MLNRRTFVTGAIAAATVVMGVGHRARASASDWLLQAQNDANGERPGTPYPLVALPGKAPMGQVYDMPPNYETPMHKLIGEQKYPFTDNEYYYVRYREPQPPKLPAADYVLRIVGDAIETEMELTLDDLKAFEPVTVACVGECSGAGRGLLRPMSPGLPWTKGDVGCSEWTGARISDVLAEAGLKDSAKFMSFRSGGSTVAAKKGDYIRTFLPESVLDNEDAILAYSQNGEPLNFWNGYPVRVVVPGTVAPRWVKQIVEIDVRTTEDDREWSGREIGKGLLPTKSCISRPADGTEVKVGDTVEIKGVAYDNGIGTARVEISTDNGSTWTEAELEERVSTYAWTVFNATVTVDAEGPFRVMSRATDNDGNAQPVQEPDVTWENNGRNAVGCDTFAAIYVGVQ